MSTVGRLEFLSEPGSFLSACQMHVHRLRNF
jgi:hypothetical protein